MFGPKLVTGTVLLNAIRKAYPKVPNTNQDGSVSVAECDTTRDIYQAALDAQGEPDWLTKARAALEDLRGAGAMPEDPKMTKAIGKLGEQVSRWERIQAKQRERLDALPDITRVVAQHEETISDEQVARVAADTWNAARLIRLFRRGRLRRWRNGAACHAYNRLCAYHDACVEGVVEPGELLVKRSHRHSEVVDAAAELGDGASPEALQRVLAELG